MLDIGFLELMLIGIVALLVLGPERLPKATHGRAMDRQDQAYGIRHAA